jgi:hypothetical protein
MPPNSADRPVQLSLFERVVPSRGRRFSQSLEFWDQMPKVVLGPPRDAGGKRVEKGARYLPMQSRQFVHEGQEFMVDIAPARLRTPGGERDIFPGLRELLVEQALRRLAIHRKRCSETVSDAHGSLVGVRFHIEEVRRDLAALQRTYSWAEIRDALLVASGAIVSVYGNDRAVLRSPIFPVALLPPEADDGAAYVAFHPLVAAGIRQYDYRQIHYDTVMRVKHVLGRWLYRRMLHHFRQADLVHSYTFLASTVLRHSGGMQFTRLRDALSQVDEAVEELRARKILQPLKSGRSNAPSHQGIAVMNGRAWVDTKYEVWTSLDFVDDQKVASVAARGRSTLIEV